MSIKDLCDKMGFHPWEGWADLEEEWLCPTVLQQTGTMEMENEEVIRVPVTVRIEYGNYDLDISCQKPAGKVA